MESQTVSDAEVIEYATCKLSKRYFLTTYCYTQDVDAKPGEPQVKLIPDAPHLDEVITFYESEQDEMLMKSRQQMVSWIIAGLKLHDLIFADPNTYAWFSLSKKEADVDNATISSMNGKVNFIYKHLADFLKRDLTFTHMKIENPITGNFLLGAASSEDAARSGAYTGGDIDEGQDVPFWETIFASVRFAVKKRLKIVFTPPKTRKAAIMRLWNGTNSFIKRTLHWSKFRSREWYDKACASLTAEQIARELDLNPGSDAGAIVWPSFDYDKHVKDALYRDNLPIELTFDFGRSDLTSVKFYQQNMSEIYLIDEYTDNMKTPHEYIKFICDRLAKYGRVRKESLKLWQVEGETLAAEEQRIKYKEMLKVDLGKIRAVGDPAGRNKEQTSSTSPIAQYAEYGLIIDHKEQTDIQGGVDQIDLRFKQLKLFIDRTCTRTIDEIQNYSYPTDKDGHKREGEKPKHDEYSHGGAALRYLGENNPLRATPAAPARREARNEQKSFKSSIQRFKRGR